MTDLGIAVVVRFSRANVGKSAKYGMTEESCSVVQVFRWVEASKVGTGKWESVGTLRQPRRKIAFEGGLYDKVRPVGR